MIVSMRWWSVPSLLSNLFLLVLIHRTGSDELHVARLRQEDGPRQRRDADRGTRTEDKKFWLAQGEQAIAEALQLNRNEGLAKNVVIVVGDGMSLGTVAAARVYKGQMAGKDGTSTSLHWEAFPHLGLSRTYNTDAMVPDSAATAFAMFSGVKTNYFTFGFDNSISKNDVRSQLTATKVDTVMDWAQREGMKTGIVTTTRITHATPAAMYAKTANRDWECDSKMPADTPQGVHDIAYQLVEQSPGQYLDVVLGGGLEAFTPASNMSSTAFTPTFDCLRSDEVDLTARWQHLNPEGKYVETRSDLKAADPTKSKKLFGLFSWDHIPYHDEHSGLSETPRLVDMTEAALKFLNHDNDRGFVLLVEGGRIDHAHHDGYAVRSLSETLEMDRAVGNILDNVDLSETLVIVTADHSHTMTMGGYPGRKADIAGVVKGDDGWVMPDMNGHPFSILSYANGPGFTNLRVKENASTSSWEAIYRFNNLHQDHAASHTYLQPSGVPLSSETHGGDDVGIWSVGPMAHLFHKTHEQTFIGHVMSVAACIGPHKHQPRCQNLAR